MVLDLNTTWAEFETSFDRYISMLPCYESIKRIAKLSLHECPNVLFHGKIYPLELISRHFVGQVFGPLTSTHNLLWEKEIIYSQSEHHFEIDMDMPTQTKNISKLTSFIKHIASHKCMAENQRHVMVLTNIDTYLNTCKSASQSFRVLLEHYSSNIIFICTASRISRMDQPLCSRFLCIRVPCFSEQQVQDIMTNLGLCLPDANVVPIHERRNIPYMMFKAVANSKNSLYYPCIAEFSSSLTLEQVRTLSQKLYTCDASITKITNDLMTISHNDVKLSILHIGTSIDHMLSTTDGNRKLLYIEYLLNAVKSNTAN